MIRICYNSIDGKEADAHTESGQKSIHIAPRMK
jgi:hypothetical protein